MNFTRSFTLITYGLSLHILCSISNSGLFPLMPFPYGLGRHGRLDLPFIGELIVI